MILVLVIINKEDKKKPLEYLKAIFMWFTIPYNGWKVITGDKDIVDEHWILKV